MRCEACGVEAGGWWWHCLECEAWECDDCSYPYSERVPHRFGCELVQLVELEDGKATVVAGG